VNYSYSKGKSSKGSSDGYRYIKDSNDWTTQLETATGSYSESRPGRDTQATVTVDREREVRSAGDPVLTKMSNDMPYQDKLFEAYLSLREWLAAKRLIIRI